MKPYYSDDHVQLWHGDCREITAWLEADVLVTDPPYGRDWRQGWTAKSGGTDGHPGIAGDKDIGMRDSALALWGNRHAIVFGDLMLPPPPTPSRYSSTASRPGREAKEPSRASAATLRRSMSSARGELGSAARAACLPAMRSLSCKGAMATRTPSRWM